MASQPVSDLLVENVRKVLRFKAQVPDAVLYYRVTRFRHCCTLGDNHSGALDFRFRLLRIPAIREKREPRTAIASLEEQYSGASGEAA